MLYLLRLTALITILAFSPWKDLQAAACCTSATAFGTGRLLLWESFAVGMRAQAIHEFGFFDNAGVYEENDYSQIDQRLRLESYSLIGLSENASLFVVLPWLFPRSGFGNDVYIGSNISDIQIGYRHQVIAIGEYEELPSLALTASILLPTGESKNIGTLGHQVTGKDALVFLAGTTFEKTWFPYFVQFNLGSSFSVNNLRATHSSETPTSVSLQGGLMSGAELVSNLVLSVMLQSNYEFVGKYKLDCGFSISWQFDPHLTAQANINSDILLSGFGANLPGSISYGFGLRYGYF